MRRFAWAALAALAVFPYLPALHAPLLYDDRTVLDNRWLAREAGPVEVFRHDFFHGSRHEDSYLYRPLTVLSLAWNLRATPSKEGIRAVNLALHALATLALAGLLAQVAARAAAPPAAAWIGAALFAVHPLASEAVLWAVGRAEILAAILGIAAFRLYVSLDDDPAPGGWKLALAVAAFFAALCFKESAAAWIAIGAAWTLIVARRVPLRIAALRAGCFAAALAAFLALRGSVVGWSPPAPPFVDNPLSAAGLATRAANAALLFARYVGKMIWPRTLSIEYGFDQIPVVRLLPWGALLALLVAGILAGGALALVRRGRVAAAFLVAFVPCAFALTSNLVLPIGTIFAERLAYLPLAGFCGLVGLAIASLRSTRGRAAIVVVLLAAGMGRVAVRAGDYRDLATLSEATVAASPRAVRALFNAARTRARLGRTQDAVPLLERALTIWPEYARAREALERIQAGRTDEDDR